MPSLGFASDPGVIEVNLAVCATWRDYARQMDELYTAARAAGLCAHKFQFNGRETGTGGGAHVVFGGPVGELSPFFLHSALLPSIIRYFQHHPALSYAFSGAYLGPSSQAPRIDESTFEVDRCEFWDRTVFDYGTGGIVTRYPAEPRSNTYTIRDGKIVKLETESPPYFCARPI